MQRNLPPPPSPRRIFHSDSSKKSVLENCCVYSARVHPSRPPPLGSGLELGATELVEDRIANCLGLLWIRVLPHGIVV